MTADGIRQVAALLGIVLPDARAEAIAGDLTALAERLRTVPIRPSFDEEPATFQRVQRAPE